MAICRVEKPVAGPEPFPCPTTATSAPATSGRTGPTGAQGRADQYSDDGKCDQEHLQIEPARCALHEGIFQRCEEREPQGKEEPHAAQPDPHPSGGTGSAGAGPGAPPHSGGERGLPKTNKKT